MQDLYKLLTIAGACGFDVIAEIIRKHDPTDIIIAAAEKMKVEPKAIANQPMGCYSKGRRSGGYYFVLKDLKQNIAEYEKVYQSFADQDSRGIFTQLMLFRLFPTPGFLENVCDTKNPEYYDKNIIKTNENEIFVDCGAYIGDSVMNYIKHCGAYKHIYAYEPNEKNFEKCHKNLAKYENITLRQAGVGLKSEELVLFEWEEDTSSASSGFMVPLGYKGTKTSQVISLDEDIQEPVTFIKLDIEGFEIEAINGAKRHIAEDKPKLAVCVYHVVSDIWEIPQLINSINPGYRFYLRHYNATQNFDTVLYCV